MMHADPAMELIVQSDLPLGGVEAAAELDAVHAEVGVPPSRAADILRKDQRQRDERAAVAGPSNNGGEIGERTRLAENLRGATKNGRMFFSVPSAASDWVGRRHCAVRVESQIDRSPHAIPGVPEDEPPRSRVPNRFDTRGKRQPATRV